MESRTRILIADPNEDLRRMLSERLGREDDMDVVGAAADGMEALNMALELCPDVLITDLVLSRLDGLGLIERLGGGDGGSVSVIVVSSLCSDALVQSCAELGVFYFMTKPCDAEALIVRIRQLSGSLGIKNGDLREPGREEKEMLVSEDLRSIGFHTRLKGYRYLREGVLMGYYDPAALESITKTLYPAIAHRFGASPTQVERAIRHAITTTWKHGDPDALRRVLGRVSARRPTNGELMAILAENLRLGRSRWDSPAK